MSGSGGETKTVGGGGGGGGVHTKKLLKYLIQLQTKQEQFIYWHL